MDISRIQFPSELVKIIQLIANSHFVALDLEFSGIAGRRRDRKKLTLQEVYEDTKTAAEQYQILQVGITVVHEDLAAGKTRRRFTVLTREDKTPQRLPSQNCWRTVKEPV